MSTHRGTHDRPGSTQELERVAVVRDLGQLDTPPHERFDRITRVVGERFSVPIAEINLLDDYRQFTKSPQRPGQSPNCAREESFCDVTIRQHGILVVPDATEDPRFSAKTTVTGERHIRFYAGVPLVVAGHAVGTLCIADTVPREFGETDRRLLERMAAMAERVLDDSLDLRRAKSIQRSLLPARLGTAAPFAAAGFSFPSGSLTGSVYNWHARDECLTFTLINVLETGTAAAITATAIRAALQSRDDRSPAQALREVNDQIASDLQASGTWATVFHGRLDARTGKLEYVDAGHGLTIVARRSGESESLPTTGLPLGVTARTGWTTGTAILAPGDTLISSTGGVLELFGSAADPAASLASFADGAIPAEQIIDRMQDAVTAWPAGGPVTALAVSFSRPAE